MVGRPLCCGRSTRGAEHVEFEDGTTTPNKVTFSSLVAASLIHGSGGEEGQEGSEEEEPNADKEQERGEEKEPEVDEEI